VLGFFAWFLTLGFADLLLEQSEEVLFGTSGITAFALSKRSKVLLEASLALPFRASVP